MTCGSPNWSSLGLDHFPSNTINWKTLFRKENHCLTVKSSVNSCHWLRRILWLVVLKITKRLSRTEKVILPFLVLPKVINNSNYCSFDPTPNLNPD